MWIKPKGCFVLLFEKNNTKNFILFIQIPSLTFYHICSSSDSFFSSMCTPLHWSFSEPFGNKLQITSRHLNRPLYISPKQRQSIYHPSNWEISSGTDTTIQSTNAAEILPAILTMPFFLSGSESYLGTHVAAFSCHYLHIPQSWTAIILFFMSLPVLKNLGLTFLGHPAVSSWPDSSLALLLLFIVHPTTGGVNFDYLVMSLSARFLHLNSPFFPL